MAKYVELRRHTDNEGDRLTGEGVRHALEIGQKLTGAYRVMVSSGAQRSTQTLACFLAGLGEEVPGGVIVEDGLRSEREDEWRSAYQQAGSGELDAFRRVAPRLVEEDSAALGVALYRVFDLIGDEERALAVGHSPTNEAAVLGLTGEVVRSMSKGEGVLVVLDSEGFRVEPLP